MPVLQHSQPHPHHQVSRMSRRAPRIPRSSTTGGSGSPRRREEAEAGIVYCGPVERSSKAGQIARSDGGRFGEDDAGLPELRGEEPHPCHVLRDLPPRAPPVRIAGEARAGESCRRTEGDLAPDFICHRLPGYGIVVLTKVVG